MLAGLAELAARDADLAEDAFEAEQWGSALLGTLRAAPMPPGEDSDAMFLPGFIAALEALRSRKALATLRALSAVTPHEHAAAARDAADRLAAAGTPEPAWVRELGSARPVAAALMHEETFDDGLSVMVEFAAPDLETHTLGVYIDHNLGGLVKDVFLAGPLATVREQLRRKAPNGVGLIVRDLELDEARARTEAAFETLDHTWDPPVNEDVRPLRALIEARLRLLPTGFELPDPSIEVTPPERETLREDFLSSRQGQRWRGNEDAREVVELAIEFGADYNHGGPLRWSPVVVEIFMTDWLARKAAHEPAFFTLVPDVLRDWVAHAGRRRAVPQPLRREAVAAVDQYRDEMVTAVNDPEAWGPAKAFALAALDAGVDLTDPDQLNRFIAKYNEGLAA
jgi:hypothetical protein